jgi:diadenosine tetraphosphate (Ap4A) HIT family hydrolase
MNDSRPNDCPFCRLPPERVIESNTYALAVADAFPVSRGHTLIVLRRHFASFFELTTDELAAVHELLQSMKNRLEASFNPAGFNIGINVGEAAGQTVMHLHIHLIPRFVGDMVEPRGGVRNVLPGKGLYA